MDADPEFDAAIGRQAGIALDHRILDLDGAAHRVDDAAELDERAVAGALDDASAMDGDGRIDEVAAQRSKPRQRAVLVGAGRRLKPTTSAARIAASLRISPNDAPLPAQITQSPARVVFAG